MAQGYIRQSAASIVAGEVVRAAPLNAEFNQIQAAMSETTGHNHDGTTGAGAPVPLIRDADGDTRWRVEATVDEDLARLQVGGIEVWVVSSANVVPGTGVSFAFGTTALPFNNIVVDFGRVGNLTVATAASFTGSVTVTTGSTVDLGGVEVKNAGTPTTSSSLATQGYVQSYVQSTVTFTTTTTTTATIATAASVSFVLANNLPISAGAHLIFTATADNWVFGEVLAYTTATKTVDLQVTHTEGSGTYAGWTVNLSGVAGPDVASNTIRVLRAQAFFYGSTM